MNRYSRPEKKPIAVSSHPYELRIAKGEEIQKIPFNDLATLTSQYPPEFLRSIDVVVMDMTKRLKIEV